MKFNWVNNQECLWPITVVNGFVSICSPIGFLMLWVVELIYQCGGEKGEFCVECFFPPPSTFHCLSA